MIGAQQDFSYMDDNALQTALQFAQRSNNTPTFLALMAEAQKRKQMRQEAQGMQAGAQTAQRPSTVADQVMQGIANLDSGEHEYAAGGIVSFDDGGPVMYDAKGDPYTHLWHAEGSSDKNTPYWDSLKEAFGFPIEAFKRVIGAPNQRQYRAAPTAASAAPAAVPAYVDREGRHTPQDVPAAAAPAPTPTPRPAPGGIASLATSSKTGKTDVGAAPSGKSTPEKTKTAAEIIAEQEALAKGDIDAYKDIDAKAEARDADRRKELDAQGKQAAWDALIKGGIAAMMTKRADALGGIGEGMAAGYDSLKASQKDIRDRSDALEAAAEKRRYAALLAKAGFKDAAGKAIKEADALHQQAIGNAQKEDEAALDRWYKQQHIATQQQANRISAANAGRPSDYRWFIEKHMATRRPDGTYPTLTEAQDAFRQGQAESRATMRPLDQATAFAQYNKARQSGDPLASSVDFQTYYKIATGADGAGGGGKTGNPLVDKYLP